MTEERELPTVSEVGRRHHTDWSWAIVDPSGHVLDRFETEEAAWDALPEYAHPDAQTPGDLQREGS